jgi:hypothetical protein
VNETVQYTVGPLSSTPVLRAFLTLNFTLFWVNTRRIVVILYRRFETTYLSHLKGSRNVGFFTLDHRRA